MKRYILARIDPPGVETGPRELYYTILESFTSLFGDVLSAEAGIVLVSSEAGYAEIRCTRGFEHQVRTALATVTEVQEKKIALGSLATSGSLLALRKRRYRLLPLQPEESGEWKVSGSIYSARRYQGQKVDLVKKGIKGLRRVLDKYVDDKDWRWNTFGEYLSYLEGKIAINCLPLMPHSPVRLTVMGEAAYQRAANSEELNAMKAMVREGMELGAIGFSTSPRGGPAIHAGTPSTFGEHEEIIELANVAADYTKAAFNSMVSRWSCSRNPACPRC